MTIDRAIEILNPEHREHYDGLDEVNEACRIGMEALKRTRWIPRSLVDSFEIGSFCAVDNAPTVDAVPVVRCRDCVYAEKQEGRLFCHVWCGINGYGDAGYCCYGERRAENENHT